MIQAETRAAVNASLTDMLGNSMSRRTLGRAALGALAARFVMPDLAQAGNNHDLGPIEVGDGALLGDQVSFARGENFTANRFSLIQGDIRLDVNGDGKLKRLYDQDNADSGLTTYVVDGGQDGNAPYGASMYTFDGPISAETAAQAVRTQLEDGCGREDGCKFVKFAVINGDKRGSIEIRDGEDAAAAIANLFGGTKGEVTAATAVSSTPIAEDNEDADDDVVTKPNITIPAGTEMSVPGGYLCPGDITADGVKLFDDKGETGLVVRTTGEVVLVNTFGSITCIEDTQANAEMLQTEQENSGCGLPKGCDTVVFASVPAGQ